MSTTLKPPVLAADLDDLWFAAVREAMSQHEGVPVRANPLQPSIDVWSINRKAWMQLLLPGGSNLFASWEDRNAVLAKLTSK